MPIEPAGPSEPAGPMVPIKLGYIGGVGRSGSTLLSLLLGSVEGVVAVGEMRFLWQRGVRRNEVCGCGQPFRQCPFWTRVGERGFGGWATRDVDRMVALESAFSHNRSLIPLLVPGIRPAGLAEYLGYLARLYTAIQEETGCRLILDASKTATYARILTRVPELDVRVIHLIRDSRGVAYSRSRTVARPEVVVDGSGSTDASAGRTPRLHPGRTAIQWITVGLMFELFSRTGTPTIRLRYEDLVRSPQTELKRILHRLGVDGEVDLLSLESGLPLLHTVSGNRLRFQQSELRLNLDEAWREGMTATHRRMVSTMTSPLLHYYGYDLATRLPS